jgi:hypothetical protein
MPLSSAVSEEIGAFSLVRNFLVVFAAAAVLSLAPTPAFAQHGGGGGGGGHAGGGGFGGGGHFGGGGGGIHGGGGGSGPAGAGTHAGSGGGAYPSAHGSSNSTGGGHWWSGIFGGHHSSENNAAPDAGVVGKGGENSQAAIAAQRAFQNALARDNLAIHNTWQDPPPEFSGERIDSGMAIRTTATNTSSLMNARPFSPPASGTLGRPVTSGSTAVVSPRRTTTAPPPSPRGYLGPRYIGYPYYPYYPYYFYPPFLYGGLGFGFYGGYGFGCGPFWGGWGWGSCYGSSPFWGGYDDSGYGYYDNSSGEMSSSPPTYQVFSGGADFQGDNSGAVDNGGNNDNYNVTYQNAPQDTGMANDQSSVPEDQPFVLYLKDGSSYAVTRYWVAGEKLHYVTSYGGENSVSLDQVNVQETVDENAALGHAFTLTPAPAPQGPPPSMDNTPPQDSPPAPKN